MRRSLNGASLINILKQAYWLLSVRKVVLSVALSEGMVILAMIESEESSEGSPETLSNESSEMSEEEYK